LFVDCLLSTWFLQCVAAVLTYLFVFRQLCHEKYLGHLTYFLGLEVHYNHESVFLNQQKYIQDLVQFVGLTNATPVKYRRDEGDLLDDLTQYRKLVGSLIYVTITRPDISFIVHTVGRFMQAPRHFHLSTVQ
jgi:hypothetical protein